MSAYVILTTALDIITLALWMETEAQKDVSDLPRVTQLVGDSAWCRIKVGHWQRGLVLPSPTATGVGVLAFL